MHDKENRCSELYINVEELDVLDLGSPHQVDAWPITGENARSRTSCRSAAKESGHHQNENCWSEGHNAEAGG